MFNLTKAWFNKQINQLLNKTNQVIFNYFYEENLIF